MSSSLSALRDRSFGRILLIKPSSLGDIVHALPVHRGLRKRFPEARIDWLVATPYAPILEPYPGPGELILFDRQRFAAIGLNPRAAGEFVRFVRHLRSQQYDLVVDLQGLFRTGFLTRATGAAVRLGFADAREGATMFYTHRIPVFDGDTHAVDRNYGVADLLGFEDVPIEFDLDVDERAKREARTLLEAHGITGESPWMAVVPGARWDTKRWLPDRFAATIDAVRDELNIGSVLLGSAGERALCDGITEAARSSPPNLAGKSDLRQLSALIALADIVLCHDSAAMHLAVALERPLVCLIGPTNPQRTGPYRRIHDVLRLKLDCAPCYLRRLTQCRHDHRCMTELDVTAVVAGIRGALAAPACAPAKPRTSKPVT